ncbi:MAG: oxidoreductase, Gfo/Idh/MocA family [Clostridiales bacterium]|jgi:myo-inositol 2-dehydrogenase/D-chiro-inositol 1-dehydrogenase|nr:oxidoreductase, Gfo/Idh/MocA family [Clostridiales bacterium]
MKKIKLGIVGLGRLGRKHAENIAFRIPNAELVCVCSIIKEETDEVKKEWGIPYAYYDYDEMLKHTELDGVVIASSSTEHGKQIKTALEKGFHVFSEKPLGVNIEEVRAASGIVESHNDKIFQLGFMRRYDTSYAYAKKKIQEGSIGTPILIRCYGLDPVKAIKGAIAFSEKSGGLFLDMAVHDFDLARWYLESEAESVYAIGGCYSYPEFGRYHDADNGAAMVKFKNNSMALFYAGRTCHHGYHIETEIIGTEGSLRIGTTPVKNLVTIFNDSGAVNECVSGFLERFETAYLNELKEFVNCIIENRRPEVTVYDGVKATELAYAATESFKKNQLIFL